MDLPWKRLEFKEIRWPGNARVAVLLNSEYEAVRGTPFLAKGVRDFKEIGKSEFEARCGIWRILNILAKFGVQGTFFVNGATAEAFPESVQEIKRQGHEIAAHGYEAEKLWELKEEDERALIERVILAIKKVTHESPLGWMSPKGEPSESTKKILAEKNFVWERGLQDAELPYMIEIGEKKIVEIPGSSTADDTALLRYDSNPRVLFEAWRDGFDYLYMESEKSPKMFVITLHQYITGRPSRAKALDDLLDHIKGHLGVWFARNIDIADCCLKNG